MRITGGRKKIRIGDLLVEAGAITEEELQEALAYQKENGGRIGNVIMELGFISQELLITVLTTQMGIDYIELKACKLDEDLLKFADVIYNRLDAVFEEALISENLAVDWIMETELMQRKRKPLPAAVPGEKLPTNVERFLEASKGEALMFFDSYEALKVFFVQALKWEDEEDSLLPDLKEFDNFVLYANPKGLLIGPDVASYFADKHNPLYSAEEAEEEAYELFCEEGLCPFDLLKYAMEHDLLPEAQFPFENGKALLHENWDFVARWYLGEYYEGE